MESFNNKSFAENKTNSIINFFCIENVKSEMMKANLNYEKSFGIDVCNCYINNLSKNISHEKSILNCKIEANEKLKLK
tara:strand:- start:96 stop:329 length:234 start_codon:yes stop_codon:yes gene_type:complete